MRLLVAPLSRLIASNQVKAGDIVSVKIKKGEAVFTREGAEPEQDAEDDPEAVLAQPLLDPFPLFLLRQSSL